MCMGAGLIGVKGRGRVFIFADQCKTTSPHVTQGILIFSDLDLVKELAIKVFIDTESDLRLIRRIHRDVKERGRSLESIVTQYVKTVRYVTHSKLKCLGGGSIGGRAIAPDILNLTLARSTHFLNDPGPCTWSSWRRRNASRTSSSRWG